MRLSVNAVKYLIVQSACKKLRKIKECFIYEINKKNRFTL